MKQGRVVISVLAILAAFWAVMLIPIPHYVRCPFIVQAEQTENVFADVAGTLVSVESGPGDNVMPDQVIARMSSPELDSQLQELKERIEVAKVSFESLKRAAQYSTGNDGSADEMELARVELEAATADLEQRQRDLSSLEIRAVGEGTLVFPDERPLPATTDESLGHWHGYPLDGKNVGCRLEQGTLIARIVPNLSRMEAVLAVDQLDLEFVEKGQPVELFPQSIPGTVIESQASTISTSRMKSVPKALSSRFGGDIVTEPDATYGDIPLSASFQVLVPFESPDGRISIGSTGLAKIRTGSLTIGQRIMRLAQKTFRFDL